MKILAVDDNSDNLTVLKAVVAERLPEVGILTALNGPQGLALAKAEDPDVILLDIVMPGMDGYAVCRKLKQDADLQSIPVLFLTALADRDSRVNAVEAGADGFLSKPVDAVELAVQIRAMAKIKAAAVMRRDEHARLAALVASRTRELENEVAQHHRTEAALRESHGLLARLAAQVPGVVYQYRLYPDGRSSFPFSSPGMADIYEVTPEAVREDATPVFGRLHPDDRDRILAAIQESARTLQPFHCEYRVVLPRQGLRWRLSDALPERTADGGTLWHGIISDITERKRLEAALEKRLIALTRPLDQPDGIAFEDLFDMATIQRIQDEFAAATGVAALITRPDGTPITRPSNFTRLCKDIIRGTETGCRNCARSDTLLGSPHPDGPMIQPCLSGGLWDAGTRITVGDRHIANWLVGQVRDETQSEDKIREYARTIGADETTAVEAFREVPSMSPERFRRVAQALFSLSKQLSDTAYMNVQQARFIAERKHAEDELQEKLAQLERMNKLMIGRENRMIELKRDINDLCARLNLPKRYAAPDNAAPAPETPA